MLGAFFCCLFLLGYLFLGRLRFDDFFLLGRRRRLFGPAAGCDQPDQQDEYQQAAYAFHALFSLIFL
jgi:hypothetical protein